MVNPENSDSWNCLSEVEGQELMAQLFVDVIIKNTINNGKGDHFWDSCEMNLLKALVLYVDQSYAEQNRNIGEVYRLLTLSGESDLDSLFENLSLIHICVQETLHLSDAETMEVTHFERGSGLISTNNNNIMVEFKASPLEKDLITTDRRELRELLERKRQEQADSA